MTSAARAWSHGEESAQSRAAAYALDMSGRVSFAALFLHRLADEPQVVTSLSPVMARIAEVATCLEEAAQTRHTAALTVRQLIPGTFWQTLHAGPEPNALARVLLAALSEETRPEPGELRRLAGEFAALGESLERSANRLAPRP